MYTSAEILLGILALFVLIALSWRFSSRRHSLPCPSWLSWLVELDNPFTRTNRAAVIIEHLQPRPGMTILDAGCGPGRLAIPLAKKVGNKGRVVALDLQDGMLNRAREKAQTENLNNIDFVQAALGEGTLAASHFDQALLVAVLGEIPKREAALRELFNALKPGSILSVTEIIFDPHFQPHKSVATLADIIGFRVQAIFGNRLAYTMHLQKPLSTEHI